MKSAWLTDVHLDFLKKEEQSLFYQNILDSHCESILISGDIAEAPQLIDILNEMAEQINKPIYFVLGNHDYYRGIINEIRETVTALTLEHKQLFWLPASGIQILNDNTIL